MKGRRTTGLTPSAARRRPAPPSATSRVSTRCCRCQTTGTRLLCRVSSVSVPETRSRRRSRCFVVLVILQDQRVHRRGSPATVTQDEPPERQQQQHGSVSVLRIPQGEHRSKRFTCRVLLRCCFTLHTSDRHTVLVHVGAGILREQSLKTTRRAFRTNLHPY